MQLFVALNGAQFTQGIAFTYTSVDLPTLLDATPTHVPRKAGSSVTLTGDAFISVDDFGTITTGVCTLQRCYDVDATAAKLECNASALSIAEDLLTDPAHQTTNTRIVCIMPDLSGESAAAVMLKVKVGSCE